ncbi:MAG: nucleotidyl transferase AbiEii/AbiGii toxin family protein [Clostridia bacterium]
MSSNTMSLKSKIKNYAKKSNITAQVVLQNYMFEKFLQRLSVSEYKEKFVIKGGMLISAMVGLDTRSTMDLDATLKNLTLNEDNISEVIQNICNINLNDDVIFEVVSSSAIRKDDIYGGYCVKFNAIYETIITPLSIDISTGDVVTPAPIEYEFSGIFDDNIKIKIWGYNLETVMAEKLETILSRGVFSTRPRDYYDIFILSTTQTFETKVFKQALIETAKHRNSQNILENTKNIIIQIENSDELKQLWIKYQRQFSYAKNISFIQIIDAIKKLLIL